MSCECYMSRRVITSVILLVLFALLLNASLPKPQVLSTKEEEEMAIASHAKVTPDEAALVQKDLTMHRRAADESAAESSEDSTEDPLGFFTKDAKDFLKENPKMVNALKKLKPTAKEKRQNEQDQAEFVEVVNNRGMEYAKPVLKKMQKHAEEKLLSVSKPSIAVAKAYKDLQVGLWDDTKELNRARFEHSTGISMDDVDAVIEDMEMKQTELVHARTAQEEAARKQAVKKENQARAEERKVAAEKAAAEKEAAKTLFSSHSTGDLMNKDQLREALMKFVTNSTKAEGLVEQFKVPADGLQSEAFCGRLVTVLEDNQEEETAFNTFAAKTEVPKAPTEVPKKAEIMQLKESASAKKVTTEAQTDESIPPRWDAPHHVRTALGESTHAETESETESKDSSKDEDEDSGSVKLTASMCLPLLLLAMVPHYAQ